MTTDNLHNQVTQLSAGVFITGIDIAQGKYIITSSSPGTIFISSGDESIFHTTLNPDSPSDDNSVPSITMYLENGHTIKTQHAANVIFTPVENSPSSSD